MNTSAATRARVAPVSVAVLVGLAVASAAPAWSSAGADIEMVDGGIVGTASEGFTVPVGTTFYVPPFGLTDEPPFLAGLPTTAVVGGIYGPGVHESHGLSFIEEKLVYAVDVQPAG